MRPLSYSMKTKAKGRRGWKQHSAAKRNDRQDVFPSFEDQFPDLPLMAGSFDLMMRVADKACTERFPYAGARKPVLRQRAAGLSLRRLMWILALVFAPCAGQAQPDPMQDSIRDAMHDPMQEPVEDPMQASANLVKRLTDQKLMLRFEERTRWEEQDGVKFGAAVNQQDMLSRLRVGMQYRPTRWLTLSALGQDVRAPFYGKPAPSTVRDSMDLQEAWLGFSPEGSKFDFSFGRRMLRYGENRVLSSGQWTNTSRTYDHGRLEYTSRKMVLSALFFSPVRVQPDAFNSPNLGNRFWGAYTVFPKLWRGMSVDAYALRHSQNKIGGWSGAGTLGTNSFGGRFYGGLPEGFTYSLEAIGQGGHMGIKDQRAFAWVAGLARPMRLGRFPTTLSAEYKSASGSEYSSSRSGTYDQLAPANHDRFGHMDLFGWQNLKTIKVLESVNLTRALTFNVMYTDEFLYDRTDALYASNGTQLAIRTDGTAGSRVGQEVDGFAMYKWGNHTFMAGVSHFFKGQFVQEATPGINPRYFYVAQQYTLK